MIFLEYSSLDFQITRSPEASPYIYRASILEDGNVVASNDFELRQDLKLSQMLKSIEKKVTESPEEPKKHKENAEAQEEKDREEPHIEFGKMLYSKVFSGQLGEYFNKSIKEVQDNGSGLRISLRFGEDVPEISALPWEYLYDDEDFLIRRRNILISRLPAGVKKKKLEPLDSVLRMLVIISGPDDPRISPLNTEKEQEIILEAVDKLQRDQKIKVDFTEDATFENVEGYLNEQDYHIIHFTGHGISIDGKGHLVFENEDQKARLIDNKTLSDLFSERGIRLVMLSSCESAKGSNKEAFDDLASMLSKKGIPAVVAMQYSVLDDVAIKFAYNFYRAIASGKPVDLALKEARLVMKNLENGNGLDFATPVLYLSDCDCVNVGNLKPEPSEFVFKPMMMPDLQVMEKGFVARKKNSDFLKKVSSQM
ncbi:CHAT domain-containing protein [Methanosarcina barkeri CM1]|uniref:CHAT domain-containing protein n=1 Tax=Methanosarcina barkeri CM1 TaxID=796385 RepID=A0A0G3CKM3_METBA|nr:CHAT domain-containing protein [Methanosarcina barkeri CM1]